MNVFREILHCSNENSDKVYIVEVNEVNGMYVVVATWGPRLAPRLSNQIKYEEARENTAITRATKLVDDKKRSKDKYKTAKAGLAINGFKKENVAITSVIAASKVASNSVINDSVMTSKARKIRI